MKKFILKISFFIALFGLMSDCFAKDSLVIYFSRTGDQYKVGNITEGNTAIVAKIIASQKDADIFEIKPVNDDYNLPYRELTELANDELEKKARPKYQGALPDLSEYKEVYIGSPIWWGNYPMIMYTVFENNDFNGKTLIPFVTHQGSGLSGLDATLKTLFPKSLVKNGIAVRGEDCQNNRDNVKEQFLKWLKSIE